MDADKILRLQQIAKSYTREQMYRLNIEYYDKIEHLYEICFRIEDDIDAEIETEDYEEMVAKYH